LKDNDKLDLVYCFDENYIHQTVTSAYSFLNNYSDSIRLNLLTNNPEKLRDAISPLYKFQNLESINVYKFKKNKEFLFPAIENHHVTEATYYRLFLNEYLPQKTKKLLYLDSDVITMNDVTIEVKNIFHKLIDENEYLGATNYTKSINENNAILLKSLNMKSSKYFNAGVLFINYELWKKDTTFSKILSHSNTMINLDTLMQHDQDILNSYFDGKFLELDKKYNFPIFERFYKIDKDTIDNESFFIHYVGREKPWLLNGFFLEISKYYQETYKIFNKNYHVVFKKRLGFKDITNNFKMKYFISPKKLYSLIRVILSYFFKL